MEDGIISQSTKRHMCINIQGALNNATARQMAGWMTDDNGRPCSGKYVKEMFKVALFEGKRVLSMSDECDNFDYQDGCKGHPIYTVVHDWYFETGNG